MIDVFTANFSFIIISIPIKRVYFNYLLLYLGVSRVNIKFAAFGYLSLYLKVLKVSTKVKAFAVEDPQEMVDHFILIIKK